MFIFSVVVFYHIVLDTGQQAHFIGYINVVQNLINCPNFLRKLNIINLHKSITIYTFTILLNFILYFIA